MSEIILDENESRWLRVGIMLGLETGRMAYIDSESVRFWCNRIWVGFERMRATGEYSQLADQADFDLLVRIAMERGRED